MSTSIQTWTKVLRNISPRKTRDSSHKCTLTAKYPKHSLRALERFQDELGSAWQIRCHLPAYSKTWGDHHNLQWWWSRSWWRRSDSGCPDALKIRDWIKTKQHVSWYWKAKFYFPYKRAKCVILFKCEFQRFRGRNMLPFKQYRWLMKIDKTNLPSLL